MRVFCELQSGLNLGGDLLLAHGVNSVADEAWAAWSAKMAGSSLIADRVVWALPDDAEPALEVAADLPLSLPPQEGEAVNPVAPDEPAADNPEPAATVAEPGQPEVPNE